MKDKTEVEMTIKKNGRWYRFVQVDDTVFHCATCVWCRECCAYFGSKCPIAGGGLSKEIAGYFERFRPTAELVRIGVRLLKRQTLKHFPDSPFVCHGPKYPTDPDNVIMLYVYAEHRDEMPQEIQATIDRLNELGLIV